MFEREKKSAVFFFVYATREQPQLFYSLTDIDQLPPINIIADFLHVGGTFSSAVNEH